MRHGGGITFCGMGTLDPGIASGYRALVYGQVRILPAAGSAVLVESDGRQSVKPRLRAGGEDREGEDYPVSVSLYGAGSDNRYRQYRGGCDGSDSRRSGGIVLGRMIL